MQPNVISSTDIDRGLVDGIIAIYKHEGETPLECLGRLKIRFPILQNVPLSYAGRLDPLASGVMLVLSGEFNKLREKYLGFPKQYKIRVLFGIATDTGDVMGMLRGDKNKPGSLVDASTVENIRLQDEDGIKSALRKFVGRFEVPYPAYSSKPVQGKPLFAWAQENRLDEIEIPMQSSEIHAIDLLGMEKASGAEVARRAIESVSLVKGDFRQSEICEQWENFERQYGDALFMQISLSVHASSGTYMRSLAERLGAECGTKALASEIVRTKVGEIGIEDAIIII